MAPGHERPRASTLTTMTGARIASGWTWIALAAAAGALSSIVGSAVLHLPRGRFIVLHAAIVAAFVAAYAIVGGIDLRTQFARRWKAGLIGGLLLGVLLGVQVSSQPASGRADGLALLGDLLWHGMVYGTADAMLLSVVPVLALYGARSAAELGGQGSRLQWAGVALAGSVLVAVVYHAGFAEYRGAGMAAPVIGTAAITLSYLLTGSPVAPVVAHVVMHIAAVLHGMETTAQLPPHYPPG